ncbi:hypothetical protein Ae201684P_021769 [Aphanomyces euteiches]|nr:hypothetical protein Ae201684P_021769 [Aphanomyces euteiches]
MLLRPLARRAFHRSVGIVGMPNVGKSTLFNALTKTGQAQAANYPFCTIDPNVSRVSVPDPRVHTLAKMENSQKVIETQLEFVDIAGLVRGASKGEGLGNKIGRSASRSRYNSHRAPSSGFANCRKAPPDRWQEEVHAHLIKVLKHILPILEDGRMLHDVVFDHPEERIQFERLQLLTPKKALFLCNVSEEDAATGNAMTEAVRQQVPEGSVCLVVSGALEEAASQFEDEAGQMEYLECSGLSETGLTQVIRACHELLQLQSYYTVGVQEARAWTIPKGTLAPAAAGVIHSDFERLFIRAETISFDKLVEAGSMKQARDKGWIRTEGKDYVCQDGDVFHFLVGK